MLVRAVDRCARAWLAQVGLRGAVTATAREPALPEPMDSEVQMVRCASGDTLAYADTGTGTRAGPTFVAVHGAPGSARDWRYLAPVLAPGARVVRLELPGSGAAPPWDESSFETQPPDAARFARSVVEACDALGLWEAKVRQRPPPRSPHAPLRRPPLTWGRVCAAHHSVPLDWGRGGAAGGVAAAG